MKLSDVMGAAQLSSYAEVGLVIFMAVFIAVAIKVFLPGQSAEFRRMGLLPLDDGARAEGDSPAMKESSK